MRVETAGGRQPGIWSPSRRVGEGRGPWKTPVPRPEEALVAADKGELGSRWAVCFGALLGTCHPWLTTRMQEGAPRKIRKDKPFWKWNQERPTCPTPQPRESPRQPRDEPRTACTAPTATAADPLLRLSPALHGAASSLPALRGHVQRPNHPVAFSFHFSPLLPLKVLGFFFFFFGVDRKTPSAD